MTSIFDYFFFFSGTISFSANQERGLRVSWIGGAERLLIASFHLSLTDIPMSNMRLNGEVIPSLKITLKECALKKKKKLLR